MFASSPKRGMLDYQEGWGGAVEAGGHYGKNRIRMRKGGRAFPVFFSGVEELVPIATSVDVTFVQSTPQSKRESLFSNIVGLILGVQSPRLRPIRADCPLINI